MKEASGYVKSNGGQNGICDIVIIQCHHRAALSSQLKNMEEDLKNIEKWGNNYIVYLHEKNDNRKAVKKTENH